METCVVVDLSDDTEIENTKRKLDRKRFNEIKKYIPFLQFITKKDPVKNEKYIKLLEWFNSNKKLPARVATTCEYAINKRYQTLRTSMEFPPYIVSIFEGGGEAIDLISDDEDPASGRSSDLETNGNSKSNSQQQNERQITARGEKTQKNSEANANCPETSSSKVTKKAPASAITVEEGEVLSDSENESSRQRSERNYVSLSEISLKTPHHKKANESSLTREDDDDKLNQELFSRIDNLDDACKKTSEPSAKSIAKDDSILREQSPMSPRKDLKRLSPDNLSNASDGNENLSEVAVLVKKKKKKHKHKKKYQHHSNDNSETENQNESNGAGARKTKKNSKKKKEKLKISRPLYVSSDDDDDDPSINAPPSNKDAVKSDVVKSDAVKPVAVKESELFQRREPLKTQDVTTNDSNTVVLLDSDEDQSKNEPKASCNTTMPSTKSQSPTSVQPPELNEMQDCKSQSLDEQKSIPKSSPPNKMKDLNNMNLNELNDIYAKLCEKTGIQLEELLGDLVTQSSVPKEEKNPPIVQSNSDSFQPCNTSKSDETSVSNEYFNVQEEQYPQHQFIEQNIHHSQQEQHQNNQYLPNQPQPFSPNHQQQQQQGDFQSQMHFPSNQNQGHSTSMGYSYPNSLMPRLNLNDPRIVQRLKQIKDSPIHNLSIRESATLLMNSFEQRPTYRHQPTTTMAKVTSSTATTYGEHKRLKELEKKELEQAKINKENMDKEKNKSSVDLQQHTTEPSPIVSVTTEKLRKDSSGSEKSINHRNSAQEGTVENQSLDAKQARIRTRRKSKSHSGSEGSKSPKPPADAETEEETVVMSFSGRPRSRLRIDSSSSASSKDTVEFPQQLDKPSTSTTEESNILKVVQIVLSALNQKEDKIVSKPSTSRRSSRKSCDSRKSAKSPINATENDDLATTKTGQAKRINKRRKTTIDQPNKSPSKVKRGCRELENLHCTFKEYSDMFEKCSSELARSESCEQTLESDPPAAVIRAAQIGVRRKTVEARQSETYKSDTDRVNKPVNVVETTESSDETDEFDIEEHRKITNASQKTYRGITTDPFDPFLRVTLVRLTSAEILKWIRRDSVKAQNIVKLPSSSHKSKSYDNTSMLVPITSKPAITTPKRAAQKTPIHLNNDINMTLNSTKTCVLCNKRPMDLTNHYVVQHQTESYTSRLTSNEIAYLETHITLAVRHRNRYKVTCVFCQAELEDNFVNFHAHYSYHTGEFGFKCAVCDLVKPYREDVRSHQYRTSTCLNGKIRSNYLYSPDLVVIYLYVCNFCNFVQLNEANIQKHQRDHHNVKFIDSSQIKKCIIAAIDNGEIRNEVMPADREEDEILSQEREIQQLEQEFLDEYPLDIKDVLLADQNIPDSPKTSQVQSINTQSNGANLMEDSLYAVPAAAPASSVMTIIHSSNDKKCQEDHKPLFEPVEEKPDVKDLLLLEPDPGVQSKMLYRSNPLDSNYFGMFKCTLNDCWFSSNQADRFVQHILSVHSTITDMSLKCAYCNFNCSKAQSIVGHIRAKHGNSKYQCAECSYRSTIPGNVVIHRRMYHQKSNLRSGIFECFSRVNNLKERLEELNKKLRENVSRLKCQECPQTYNSISFLKRHMQMEHPLSFKNIEHSILNDLVCLHCKKESNDKERMRIHLALEHPDEMGYVAERKPKTEFLDKLNLINISLPVAPAEIKTDFVHESDIFSIDENFNDQPTLDNAPLSKVRKLNPEAEIKVDDEIVILPQTTTPSVSTVPAPASTSKSTHEVTITEEKRLKPLLELFVENTGPPPASLYRCPERECIATFLHYELWLKHVVVRHQVKNTVSCPYCFKQISLGLGEMHFESHRRHAYICFHCVMSFCSRENIFQHFAAFHPEFSSTVEKKIAWADASFSIFKEKPNSSGTFDWNPLFDKLSDALRLQLSLRLQLNQHKEWVSGLSSSCLEEVEIPQYKLNGPRFACLVRSCPFVGLNEAALMLHLANPGQHDLPPRYTCSHCAISQVNPSWENIKDHKMLHKDEIHLCCVCNSWHHSFTKISAHIDRFHSIRDVPVISIKRDELKYLTSISIVLPENKTNFSTSETCFCCKKTISKKLIFNHLKKEHKITLLPKCVLCNAIIHTNLDAEMHAKEHQSTSFKLKFEILTPFLYKAIVTSSSPFSLEIQLAKEKHSLAASQPVKLEVPPVEIKKEVTIKTESEEIVDEADQPTCAALKCVNLDNLIDNRSRATPRSSGISVLPMSSLTTANYPSQSVISITTPPIIPQPSAGVQLSNVLPIRNTPPVQFNEHLQRKFCEYNLPELAPICGICGYECADFSNLTVHFSSMHGRENQRFLFRVTRKVECLYCPFQSSLSAMSVHQDNVHPSQTKHNRSVKDKNRCGVCHQVFTPLVSVTSQTRLACACPNRRRLLADCLDFNTLRLLQNFGQNHYRYTCDICNTYFNDEQLCRRHIVQAHKKAIYPKLTSVELLFVCSSCDSADSSIDRLFEHIYNTHVSSRNDPNLMSVFRKIQIIYRRGLTICAEDLAQIKFFHDEESLKRALGTSEIK